ncbi:MAG: hypothetical protein JST06_07860 [Bacteroidetes bacterium]|nr:hypothetical protein [Bacteroidota bacterium]MBS1628838.1 hypothetical protein [Bacteroidota bacterium]
MGLFTETTAEKIFKAAKKLPKPRQEAFLERIELALVDASVRPNRISWAEIVAETKAMRADRKRKNASKK